jgi:hypothetical protein
MTDSIVPTNTRTLTRGRTGALGPRGFVAALDDKERPYCEHRLVAVQTGRDVGASVGVHNRLRFVSVGIPAFIRQINAFFTGYLRMNARSFLIRHR